MTGKHVLNLKIDSDLRVVGHARPFGDRATDALVTLLANRHVVLSHITLHVLIGGRGRSQRGAADGSHVGRGRGVDGEHGVRAVAAVRVGGTGGTFVLSGGQHADTCHGDQVT